MLSHIRRNAVAYLALFVALSGTSYAAITLPRNSVGSEQLRTHAVTRSKLADGAVTQAALAKGVAIHGPRGPKGDPGTTEGVVSAFGGATPSPMPDIDLLYTTLTTTTSGRLFAFARGRYSEDCSASSQVQLGVYVDGVGVPASGFTIPPGTGGAEISVWGLTAEFVPAGEHTFVVAGDCVGSDSVGGSAGGDAAVGAIVLGR